VPRQALQPSQTRVLRRGWRHCKIKLPAPALVLGRRGWIRKILYCAARTYPRAFLIGLAAGIRSNNLIRAARVCAPGRSKSRLGADKSQDRDAPPRHARRSHRAIRVPVASDEELQRLPAAVIQTPVKSYAPPSPVLPNSQTFPGAMPSIRKHRPKNHEGGCPQ
jgi:hypothetical protein